MNVTQVVAGSSAFAAVLKLWRGESSTLGFMPEGGFEDAARDGCLLISEAPDGGSAGYIMFRRTVQKVVSVTHLCVAPTYRRCGVARALFDAMKSRCGDCYEIRLRCRRDFSASALWPKLGFVAVRDEPARARDGILTTWRYEIAALPLFRVLADAQPPSGAVRVVIDANVFFDLDEVDGALESAGLVADWLGEYVELAVTEELFNEINRRRELDDRERQRGRARKFVQVPRDVPLEEAMLPKIQEIVACSDRPSALSDARQVAMTVAGGVTFFVTRDGELLRVADQLDDEFGLRVLSPHEIVRHCDELRREEDYRPRRLFLGPAITSSLARADDLDSLAELMHAGQAVEEPKRHTRGRLREMMASPDRFQATCIADDGELLAAYIVDRAIPDVLRVPFFAVASSPLGRTLARHYSEALVVLAASEGRRLVQVEAAGARVEDALAETGFAAEAGAWVKITLPVALPLIEVAGEVERIGGTAAGVQFAGRVANELRAMARGHGLDRGRAADIERAIWPAKLVGADLPSFIVPIQPRWAKDLFDRELAERTLFGAKASVGLNCENVYYRAARPAVVTAPGRVLWYVSNTSAYPQSMAIRACSHVDEVVVGVPKDLFHRFKRLGIYAWSDVLAAAKQDVSKEIMAFRFSRTELLRRPIPWDTMQGVLTAHTGRRSQLQSPVRISEECFLNLYLAGTRADAA